MQVVTWLIIGLKGRDAEKGRRQSMEASSWEMPVAKEVIIGCVKSRVRMVTNQLSGHIVPQTTGFSSGDERLFLFGIFK